MSKPKHYCFIILILFSAMQLKAQQIMADTLTKLLTETVKAERLKLFVHYDKNVYLPSETIWFTAYKLGNDSLTFQADVLSVILIKNDERQVVLQKKFMFNGVASSGTLLIPDSVAAGEYSLVAYSNFLVNGKPGAMFSQHISIKHIAKTDANIQKTLVDTIKSTLGDATHVNISFYPEGGDLIAGLPNYVGIEAKNNFGQPLQLKAVLLKDGTVADTIQTSAIGLCRIYITPQRGSNYKLRLLDNSGSYDLPALSDGVVISTPKAIANDTLRFRILSNLKGKLHIVIHNAVKVFSVLNNIDPDSGKLFKLLLDSLPRGLAAITIYKDDFSPCAERIFYAHYNSQQALVVVPNQPAYSKRKKVTLRLNFNSLVSQQALISVACVKGNRINPADFNDIQSYAYIGNALNKQLEKKQFLEDILLVKGWRRYQNNILKTTDTIHAKNYFQLNGIVTIHKKPVKKSQYLMLFGDSVWKPVLTDSLGRFTIANTDLITKRNREIGLLPTGNSPENINIILSDPFLIINQKLAASIPLFRNNIPDSKNNITDQPSTFENQVMLKQVTIKASKNSYMGFEKHYTEMVNDCGDYVCQAGILNCTNHGPSHRSSLPVAGHRYPLNDGSFVVYQACEIPKVNFFKFNGINMAKVFYPYDDRSPDSPEVLYQSTLYWNNCIKLEKGKDKLISFYTGDIEGVFKVIIQGVADSETISAEQVFEVAR